MRGWALFSFVFGFYSRAFVAPFECCRRWRSFHVRILAFQVESGLKRSGRVKLAGETLLRMLFNRINRAWDASARLYYIRCTSVQLIRLKRSQWYGVCSIYLLTFVSKTRNVIRLPMLYPKSLYTAESTLKSRGTQMGVSECHCSKLFSGLSKPSKYRTRRCAVDSTSTPDNKAFFTKTRLLYYRMRRVKGPRERRRAKTIRVLKMNVQSAKVGSTTDEGLSRPNCHIRVALSGCLKLQQSVHNTSKF